MKGPRVEIRSQSEPKWPRTTLPLGRLAEDAHVGGAAVRDEVARAGRVAAVLRALRVAPLRLLDLADDGGDQHVALRAARRRPGARAPPRRSRRARPSCSRSRGRRSGRPRTNPSGWKPGIPASHGSRPEYDVSMWPLNISVGPPPAPGHVPRTFARPSSTCCHCTWRPIAAERVAPSARAIASSSPVKLGRRDGGERHLDQAGRSIGPGRPSAPDTRRARPRGLRRRVRRSRRPP